MNNVVIGIIYTTNVNYYYINSNPNKLFDISDEHNKIVVLLWYLIS